MSYLVCGRLSIYRYTPPDTYLAALLLSYKSIDGGLGGIRTRVCD